MNSGKQVKPRDESDLELQRRSGTRLPSRDEVFSVTQTRQANAAQLRSLKQNKQKAPDGTAIPGLRSTDGTKAAQNPGMRSAPPKSTWNLRIHQRNIHGDVAGVVNEIATSRASVSGLQAAMVTDQSSAEFDILGQLGMGNMGVVYRARQASLNRELAIKTLKPHDGDVDHDFQAMFVSEAVVTANLLHPNIVPIHDLGRTADGKLFYTMKQVSGTPWSHVIRERSLEDNLEIFMKVCDAVAYAHSNGVVNRDLKPENVVVGGYGEVIVLDWGLAITTERFAKRNSIALDYEGGWGTPPYMAPELLDTDVLSMGPHSDIYLLGAILYEILEGFPPHYLRELWEIEDEVEFESRLITAVRENQIEQDGTQQGELKEIALRAMSTWPEDRFSTVEELQEAIREYRITGRAEELLQSAEGESGDQYANYQSAVALYAEALRKWPGNRRAIEGNRRARLAYADLAGKKGDIDLGLQVVDGQNDALFVPVAERLKKSKLFRKIVRTTWAVMSVAVTVLLVVTAITYIELKNTNGTLTQVKAEVADARKAVDLAKEDAEKAKADGKRAKEEAQIAVDLAEEDAEKAKADGKRAKEEAREAVVLAIKDAEKAKADGKRAKEEAREAVVLAEAQATAALHQKTEAEQLLAVATGSLNKALTDVQKTILDGLVKKIESYDIIQDYPEVIRTGEEILSHARAHDLFTPTQIMTYEKRIQDAKSKVGGNGGVELKDKPKISAISADGSTVVVYSEEPTSTLSLLHDAGTDGLQFVDSAPAEKMRQVEKVLQLNVRQITVSHDGRLIAVAGNNVHRLWQRSEGKLVSLNLPATKAGMSLIKCQFSPDGKHLYQFFRLGEKNSLAEIYRVDGETPTLVAQLKLELQLAAVTDILVLPDETAILAITSSGTQSIPLDLKNGSLSLKSGGGNPNKLDKLNDEKLIKVTGGNRFVPNNLYVSADGLYLALVQGAYVLILPRSAEPSAKEFPFVNPGKINDLSLLSCSHTVRDVAFSSDSSRIVTAHDERYLQVWDRESDKWTPSQVPGLFKNGNKTASALRGHSKPVRTVLFKGKSADELVSVSADRFVRIWNIANYAAYGELFNLLTALPETH